VRAEAAAGAAGAAGAAKGLNVADEEAAAPHKREWSAPVGGFPAEIEECHRRAMEADEDMYTDPETGFMVP